MRSIKIINPQTFDQTTFFNFVEIISNGERAILQGGLIKVKTMTGYAVFQDHRAIFLARGAL
jgi:hypothetical protein